MSIHTSIASLFSPAEWLGMPENYSVHGDEVTHTIDVVNWFMIALFIGWTVFFLICLFRFHKKRNPKASYHGVKNHASTHLEIGVVIVEAVLLLGFALPLWAKRTDEFESAIKTSDPVRVRAIGFQFGWKFHYAGNDGIFGYIDRTLVKAPGDACVDPSDPNGFDDFVVGALKLPVDRPAIVQLTSTDVIHNFSIIPMRIQQDAFPGKDIPMKFEPTKEIVTHVVCGQLCGESHANMIGTLEVVSQKAYTEWSSKQSQDSFATNKAANDSKKESDAGSH